VNAGAVSLSGRLSSSAQSAVWPPFPDSDPERWSLRLLFRRLWNWYLRWKSLFAGPRDCVPALPASVSLLFDLTFCIENESALFEFILGLGSDYFRLLRHVRWDCLTQSLPPAFVKVAGVMPDDALWALSFSSMIIADFPGLFAEFRRKCFTLL
jgi:hypothetical protein